MLRKKKLILIPGKKLGLLEILNKRDSRNVSNRIRSESVNSLRRFSEQDRKLQVHRHLERIEILTKNDQLMKVFNKLKTQLVTKF